MGKRVRIRSDIQEGPNVGVCLLFHQIYQLNVDGADQVSKIILWRNLRCVDKQESSPSDDKSSR